MLEIVVLYFITREIGILAERKGQKTFKWKCYTVFGWLSSETFGIIVGFMFFSKDNLISVILVGLAFAVTSYFFIKAQLNKLPNRDIDDQINNIGHRD